MPQATIVYWRDIPAQVLVGRGRTGVKRPLSERFEAAIDRAAMKAGLSGTDDYLAEWRRETVDVDGAPEAAAEDLASRLEAEHPPERLKTLIEAGGRAPA